MAKLDTTKDIMKVIAEAEAAAELMQEKAIQLKDICSKAKTAMEGVSTLSIKKDSKAIEDALAKSIARRRRA